MTNREQQQQDRAEARKRQLAVRSEIAPAATQQQPPYRVPESDIELRAAQTASWDTSQELILLRLCLNRESERPDPNPNTIMGLTRAIDMMIARNQSTALKCGAYLSRETYGDFIKALIAVACETVQEYAPDQYEPIIDTMRERMQRYFDPAAIAAANAQYEA